ncbi:hypothetical protein [Salsuginibacillus kocurii]|uniref:hypothetical protein n=1 Tax=Salsuginibacillus kocurii TaxID=427078 RepID=UPI0003646151|nr:hypothetical protein [Salsuginibacillus kocurii]
MTRKETLPLQMECTFLFQSNPDMAENIEGLEALLGRTKEEILPVLEALVQQDIIQKTKEEASTLFRYKEPVITKTLDITSEVD